MKKFGFLIFIVAILVGVVFANLFSFGRASTSLFTFSLNSGIKGSSVAGSEVRNVGGFKSVEVGGVFQVEIVAGNEFHVEVQADDNLLQYIKTDVDGGVLKIATTEKVNSRTPMRIMISAPNLEGLDASGACKVSAAGLNSRSFDLGTSGASKVKLSGQVSKLEVVVSGASNIDAEDLKSETANVEASGASKVSVFVTERLISSASGASKISYAGNPKSVEKESTGASSVSAR